MADPFIGSLDSRQLGVRAGRILGRGGEFDDLLRSLGRSLRSRLQRSITESVASSVGGGLFGGLLGGLAGGVFGSLFGGLVGNLFGGGRSEPRLELPELERDLDVSFPERLVPDPPPRQGRNGDVSLSLEGVIGDPEEVSREVREQLERALRMHRLGGER